MIFLPGLDSPGDSKRDGWTLIIVEKNRMTNRRAQRAYLLLFLALLVLAPAGLGCSFEEAVVDGFYGGISDTIATVISDAALGAASP